MTQSNALSAMLPRTLTPDQEVALINARGRMLYLLDDCMQDLEIRWGTALSTWEHIDELQRAFPATFAPEQGLEDPLPHYLEGC